MRMTMPAVLLSLMSGWAPAHASAQDILDVRQLVTAPEFDAMGLNKLSDAELRRLNVWLLDFAETVYQAAGGGAVGDTPAIVESQIEGDFECWEGDTIFKLLNGQIWQQTDYQYKYCYSFMPEVVIYKSGDGYRMKVDGVDGTVHVRRIK